MEAVAQTPFFAQRILARPSNRERLLDLDPAEFAKQLKSWNEAFFYNPKATLAGVADAVLPRIDMPTLIVAGNDDVHPPSVSDALAGLIPNASLIASPWSNDDWLDKFTGRAGGSVFDLYPLLAPHLLKFVREHR